MRLLFQPHLCRFDGGGQLAADRRQMLPAEAVDLGQQGRHSPQDVVALEAIVLQIGQQCQHVHRHAFAAAGQHLARFKLVVLDGLELVDLGLTEPTRLRQAGQQRLDLGTATALDPQCPFQLGHDELLAAGNAILQLLGRDDRQAPRIALAGLRQIVGGRGVEGHLRPRFQLQRAEVPEVVDRAAIALLGPLSVRERV